MKTPEQRLDEFKERLADLMEEYGVHLEARSISDPCQVSDFEVCLDMWTSEGWMFGLPGHALGWHVDSESLQTP